MGELATNDPVLSIEAIDTYYGESHVLHDLSLTGAQGEVVTLEGRNGAGKTTTLRSVIGLTPPRSGAVRLNGEAIHGLPTHEI